MVETRRISIIVVEYGALDRDRGITIGLNGSATSQRPITYSDGKGMINASGFRRSRKRVKGFEPSTFTLAT